LVSKPPRSVFHQGIGFPGTDGPARRHAEPLVFGAYAPSAPLRVPSILSDWLGPQPYDVHQPLLADHGRSPRLLGLLATGNPYPPV
jgi:hypothetical protein